MQHQIPEHPASHLASAAVIISLIACVFFGAMVWY